MTIAEMPSHNHTSTVTLDMPGNNDSQGNYIVNGEYWGMRKWTFNFNTDFTGGNQAHENRPPYFAIYYIMKS